jgi:hypothetical protein
VVSLKVGVVAPKRVNNTLYCLLFCSLLLLFVHQVESVHNVNTSDITLCLIILVCTHCAAYLSHVCRNFNINPSFFIGCKSYFSLSHSWQPKSWRINLILRIMMLVLLYELITGFGRIFVPKIDRTQRLLDMVKDCTISSWRNLTASNSNSRRFTLYYK